jgi:hypothetical protein
MLVPQLIVFMAQIPLVGQGFTIIFIHTTLGRIHLDERSARLRDIYLKTNNNRKWKISVIQAGFEPTIPVRERPHTHTLDSQPTGIGNGVLIYVIYGINIFMQWEDSYLCHCLKQHRGPTAPPIQSIEGIGQPKREADDSHQFGRTVKFPGSVTPLPIRFHSVVHD